MIAKDKLMHIAMGIGACVVMAIAHHFSLGLSLAIGATSLGVFYEFQQWYRKEGQPELMDALATASPGLIAYVILDLIKWS